MAKQISVEGLAVAGEEDGEKRGKRRGQLLSHQHYVKCMVLLLACC